MAMGKQWIEIGENITIHFNGFLSWLFGFEYLAESRELLILVGCFGVVIYFPRQRKDRKEVTE